MKHTKLMPALFAFLLLGTGWLNAQIDNISAENLQKFKAAEDTLERNFLKATNHPDGDTRLHLNFTFIPQLVEVLKHEQSFYYPFEKVKGLSVLYAPDNKFRIFTWACKLVAEEGKEMIGVSDGNEIDNVDVSNKIVERVLYKYYGAIQMNDSKELKILPLIDQSRDIWFPEDTVLVDKVWYGSVYYNIVKKEHAGNEFYTLFGWDGNNKVSTKKIADVLTFNEAGKAVFGAPIFELKREDQLSIKNRFVHEFKKGAGVSLNYHPDKDQIVFDYIAPPTPESRGNFVMYIPDGTYQGLEFKDGVWRYVEKVFFDTLSETDLETSRQDYVEKSAKEAKAEAKKRKKNRKKKAKKNKNYSID